MCAHTYYNWLPTSFIMIVCISHAFRNTVPYCPYKQPRTQTHCYHPTSQRKKQRLREAEPFAQAQTASPGQDWSLNPGQPTSQTTLLPALSQLQREVTKKSCSVCLKQKAQEAWGWEDEVVLPHPEDVKHLLSAREPQGSCVHSPKKGHPEQESPTGPRPRPRRVT